MAKVMNTMLKMKISTVKIFPVKFMAKRPQFERRAIFARRLERATLTTVDERSETRRSPKIHPRSIISRVSKCQQIAIISDICVIWVGFGIERFRRKNTKTQRTQREKE